MTEATQENSVEGKELIPVFFCIDDSFAPFLGVAVQSLIDHTDPQKFYRIHILHQGELSPEHREKLEALARENVEFAFTSMEGKVEGIVDCASTRLRQDYFALSIFYRLFIAQLFPQYDKAIYLDSDIVVLDDVANMYNIDLEDNYIGACQDYSILGVPPFVDYIVNMVGIEPETYINSGILLLNCKALRERNFAGKFLDVLNTYNTLSEAPDQDYLNFFCNGNIKYLDKKWDAMPLPTGEPVEKPSIIHYNLFEKPWCYDDVPYGQYFWQYADQSAFKDEIHAVKDAYTDEKKASDQASLALMLENAPIFSSDPNRFRALFESGKIERL